MFRVARLACGVVGIFGMAATYNLLFIYTAELFPTAVRNTALGWMSQASQMGAILAPPVVVGFFGDGPPCTQSRGVAEEPTEPGCTQVVPPADAAAAMRLPEPDPRRRNHACSSATREERRGEERGRKKGEKRG